jgi:hypothetical protein
VEMNWVATEFESLTYILKLDVADSTDTGLITRRVDHNVSTILVLRGDYGVASEDNISG